MSNFFESLSSDLKRAVERHYEFIIRQIFHQNMTRFYNTHPVWETLPESERQYWVGFMSAGVYAIWREWLLNGQREPLSRVHDLIGKLQNATLAALV